MPNWREENLIDPWANVDIWATKQLNDLAKKMTESVNCTFDVQYLKEYKDEYIAQFEVPGFTENDIKISQNGDILMISGERPKQPVTLPNWQKIFVSKDIFSKSIVIPNTVDHSKISACVKDGILTIALKKINITENIRSIPVAKG